MRNSPDRRQVWADYVRRLRDATGLSRPALAQRLGIDPATVWRWESAKQKPESPDIPLKIAELFRIDVDEVLGAAGLKPNVEFAVPEPEFDEELELVRTDRRLTDDMKARIIRVIFDRRARDKAASIEETRRIIEMFRRRDEDEDDEDERDVG